jgi:uncharacterized damage-inducible protein DinB
VPQTDPVQILFAHDRWATAQILDASGKLSADQFHRRFDIGPGSLHDTLTHIVGAMRTWTDTLSGAELRPRPDTDGQRRTPDQIRALHQESCQELTTEARRRPLAEMVTRRARDGRSFDLTRAAALMQVLTHGMHHRAQCLNMLRQLGVNPLPPSSVAEWTMKGEAQG